MKKYIVRFDLPFSPSNDYMFVVRHGKQKFKSKRDAKKFKALMRAEGFQVSLERR